MHSFLWHLNLVDSSKVAQASFDGRGYALYHFYTIKIARIFFGMDASMVYCFHAQVVLFP